MGQPNQIQPVEDHFDLIFHVAGMKNCYYTRVYNRFFPRILTMSVLSRSVPVAVGVLVRKTGRKENWEKRGEVTRST